MSNGENFNILNKESIKKIESLFGCSFEDSGESLSLRIKNIKSKNYISLDIFLEPGNSGLISVYTDNAHLQLQSCSGFILSNMLEEVIFISESGDSVSGLIISKQGDCSLYANVKKELLNKDFMELSSEKLLAVVALSVVESTKD
ncbi:MAG: hypothetical protein HY959_03920 [Ignavibacteriae bacterium]|nr:hypothetical protein [Ignavibacteriota bacterium]